MNLNDSIRIMELLASKICHDLISPVGAVSNGVEVLEEIGAEDDVIELIGFSAAQANAKLRALRLAYGLGGSDDSIRAEEVHKIFGAFIAGENRLTQDWDPYADLGLSQCEGFAKIMLCALILASEALPKGGILRIKADGDAMIVSSEGENAHFREGYVHALEHRIAIDNISPQLVHAYVTGLLSTNYGFHIAVDESQDNFISLRLTRSDVS